MYKEKESGRSMVEMLGVLAIIGVLSVGGIAGYTTAMNKHRANQILNGASIRAIVVSTQIQRGANTPTLGEFTDNEVGGAKFGTAVQNAEGTTDWTTTDKRFSLTLTGVDEKICTQMKASVGENGIIKAIADNCTTITYNNDLSTTTSMTDHKDSTSCESAGGVWNNTTKTCGCPGRYTGSNCEIAPTSCPSGTTTTEDGKCKWCYEGGDWMCAECAVEEEGGCAPSSGSCFCYNPKTRNVECNYGECAVCDKSGEKPDPICPNDGSGCICYNAETQNVECNEYTCGACDKNSENPDVICTVTGDCSCYNKEKQNVKCGNYECLFCDKNSTTPTPYFDGSLKLCYNSETQNLGVVNINGRSEYILCDKNGATPTPYSEGEFLFCYNSETQNLATNSSNYVLCDKNSDLPDAKCPLGGACVCYNRETQNGDCDMSYCLFCDKNSTTPTAHIGQFRGICYNGNTQNVMCGPYDCAICEKNSTTPIAQCGYDGDEKCSCVAE